MPGKELKQLLVVSNIMHLTSQPNFDVSLDNHQDHPVANKAEKTKC